MTIALLILVVVTLAVNVSAFILVNRSHALMLKLNQDSETIITALLVARQERQSTESARGSIR